MMPTTKEGLVCLRLEILARIDEGYELRPNYGANGTLYYRHAENYGGNLNYYFHGT